MTMPILLVEGFFFFGLFCFNMDFAIWQENFAS